MLHAFDHPLEAENFRWQYRTRGTSSICDDDNWPE